MSLKTDFEKLRDDLFSDFSDFIESSATLKDRPTNTYNPATGTNSVSFSVSETIECFLKDYSQQQVSGEILPGDTEIIINPSGLSQDITTAAIITASGKEYKVLKVNPVPKTNPVIFRCHCRGSAGA